MSTIDLNLERGLPAAVDAERSILGAVLLDNTAYFEASQAIRVDDFSLESHRRLYGRMVEISSSGRPIDLITVTDELAKRKEVESVGGVAYISSLMDGLPRRPSIAQYVRIVKEKANARNLIHACSAATERVVDTHDAEAAWTFLDNERLASGAGIEAEPEFGEGMRQTVAGLLLAAQSKKRTGFPTGVADLDAKFVGYKPGELTYIGARPSVGKSSIMVQGILENARRGIVSKVFNLEMTRDGFNTRCIAAEALMHPNKLRNPETMTRAEQDRLADAVEHFTNLSKYILLDSRKGLKPSEVVNSAKHAIRTQGAQIVWIDHFTKMKLGGENYRISIIEGSNQIAMFAKDQAWKAPVVCLVQLNRQNTREETVPLLKDLKESGNFEEDGDNVLLIHRPSEEGIFTGQEEAIFIAKQRDGKRDVAQVRYDEDRLIFT